jgi:large subunit ribosomal protein L10
MATEAKVRTVEEFAKIVEGASGIVLTDFTGLDVAAVSDLRRKCRAAGVQYRVVKNTLAKRAIADQGLDSLAGLLEGPNAWAIHRTDQVAAAKVLSVFAKDHQNLKIRGGFVDGRLISVQQIDALAKLPGREVLLAQVLAGMSGPMSGFAGVLSSLLRGFATAVDAYAKKRAETEPEA